MRIGILTYHRSQNYGALLQAVALRYVLTSMGHEVHYVDYWPNYHRQMYALFSFSTLLHSGRCRGPMRYLLNTLKYYNLRKERIANLKAFIGEYIEPYCEPYDSSTNYDVLIYGSDQIWRKQPTRPASFNPVYFGVNIIKASSHVSYAASMGQEILNDEDKAFLKDHLSRFTKLLVREEQLKDTLSGLGLNSKVVLDPTLLLSKEQWESLLHVPQQTRGRYILYYRLLMNSFDEEQLSNIAKRMNCQLVVLDSVPRTWSKDHLSTCGPQEFLSLIKYAEVVFTSSYHGLVFSLLYNKTFYASFSRNEGRARSLLSKLGLQSRLLDSRSKFSEVEAIDYSEVYARLLLLKKDSLSYLIHL